MPLRNTYSGEKNPESEGCYLNKILTKLHTTFWKKVEYLAASSNTRMLKVCSKRDISWAPRWVHLLSDYSGLMFASDHTLTSAVALAPIPGSMGTWIIMTLGSHCSCWHISPLCCLPFLALWLHGLLTCRLTVGAGTQILSFLFPSTLSKSPSPAKGVRNSIL